MFHLLSAEFYVERKQAFNYLEVQSHYSKYQLDICNIS